MSDPVNLAPAQGGPLPPRGPRSWVMILVGLVIVASGAVIGAGTTMLVLKGRLAAPPPPGTRAAEMIRDDLRRRLDLTDEQARQVGEIMARRMETLETIRREAHEKMTAEHDKLRAEMKAVLRPEQFKTWSEQFDALRPPGFGGPPGCPGPGRPGPVRPGPGGPPSGYNGGRGQGPGYPPPPGGPGQGPGPGRFEPGGGPRMPGAPPPAAGPREGPPRGPQGRPLPPPGEGRPSRGAETAPPRDAGPL